MQQIIYENDMFFTVKLGVVKLSDSITYKNNILIKIKQQIK